MKKQMIILFFCLSLLGVGCAPKVKIEAPEKPIKIDLNVKVDHEVRIKIEKDVEKVLSKDSGLF